MQAMPVPTTRLKRVGSRAAVRWAGTLAARQQLVGELSPELTEATTPRRESEQPTCEVEYGASGLAGPEAKPGAIVVELQARRAILVEGTVDLTAAVWRNADESAHVLGGRDREEQSIEFGATDPPSGGRTGPVTFRRLAEPSHELVDVVPQGRVELDQLNSRRRRVLVIP